MNHNYIGKHIIVIGLVQGVFFRAFTKEQADKFQVLGWTRNLSDGSVEIMAFAIAEDMQKFIHQLEIGPKAAKVTHLEISDVLVDVNCTDFQIIASK